jgi:adenylate cyclase
MAEDRVQRRLAAILAADVAGYSRLVGFDEEGTLARLKVHRRELIDSKIAEYTGRIVKTTGDGILVEFASAVDAVRCAIGFQRGMAERNSGVMQNQRIEFRIGVHVGDVVTEDGDILGDCVNIAARLEGIAEPGGISVSEDAHRQVRGKLDALFEDKGNQQLKNIASPVRVYAIQLNGASSGHASPTVHPALPDKPSLVVLPFENISAEPGQDYLADGIVEAITAALSRIRSFFVIARNSAFTYKGRATNARDIGRELGVAYLIEGSVQKGGNRLRITVQLVETETGAHVWASRYDGTVDDIFDLQDRITEQLAGAIQPSIRIAEVERVRRKRPQDLGAYDYTMQAMPHVWALEKDEAAKALDLLDKALAIDPDYPLALSLAGWCHGQRSVYNFVEDVSGSQAKARSMAERAAELGGDDPIILAVLGAVHTFTRNLGTARILLERAVTLDPNAAWAWQRLGWVENYSERPRDAIAHFERALRLSPLDPINFNNYVGFGSSYELLGEYDKAVEMYRRGLHERPNTRWLYRHLAGALSGAGRTLEAKAALVELLRSYPDFTIAKFRQAMVFAHDAVDRMAENLRRIGVPE